MINLKKNIKIIFLLFFLIILVSLFYLIIYKFQKNETMTSSRPISINLLTVVHPDLPWDFKPVKENIFVEPGVVTTIEYIVENIDTKDTTGFATFAYYPNSFGEYVSKLNCFCYDAQTLKPKEKSKFSLILLIDPEVTKDSKTKGIKEATIQFTFFDYKEYKDKKS